MGQTTSSTSLDLVQSHIKYFKHQAGNFSLTVWSGRLTVFCKEEWPAFNVGWPEGGTFYLPTVYLVKGIVYGNPRLSDQVPYFTIWQHLVKGSCSWLKPFLPPTLVVLQVKEM